MIDWVRLVFLQYGFCVYHDPLMVLLPSTWGRHALAGDGGVAWLLVSYVFSRVSNVAQAGQTIWREIKITNQGPANTLQCCFGTVAE